MVQTGILCTCLFSSDLASEFEAVCQERDMLNRQIKEDAVTVKTKLNQIHKTRKFILEILDRGHLFSLWKYV